MNRPKKRLGELLIEAGLLDEHQLRSALNHQQQWGGRLGKNIVKLNMVEEDALLAFLARHFRLPAIDFTQIRIQPGVLKLVPRDTAVKHHVMPLFVGEEGKKPFLALAMANPADLSSADEIEFATRKKVRPVVASDSGIEQALAYYYDERGTIHFASDAKVSSEMSYNDLIRITRDYLKRVQPEPEPAAAPATSSASSIPLAEPDDDDSIIVFGSAGERTLPIDADQPKTPAPQAAPKPEAARGEPTTDEVLRALVNVLVDKGILTRDELLRRLR